MNRASSFFFAVVVVISAGFLTKASAQNTPAVSSLPETVHEAPIWRLIPVKNISPRNITSRYFPTSDGESSKQKSPNYFTFRRGGGTEPRSELPKGVKAIFPVDNQNAVLALGNEAGIKELERYIAFFDSWQSFIEVETRIVRIKPEDCIELGIVLPKTPAFHAGVSFTPVPGNFPRNWKT